MAQISNQQAVNFSNARLRPAADALVQLYLEAKTVVALWNAMSIASVLPNTTDTVADGSPADGRPQITGAQATAIVTRLQEFITDYEANSNAKLNTVLQVAANP